MKILFVDLGQGIEHAARLAADGNVVYYYVPWEKSQPNFRDWSIGLGHGVEKVKSMGSVVDEIDLAVFGDVGYGWFADALRTRGIPVFGAGKAEELEFDRMESKRIMAEAGIAFPETSVVRGVRGVEAFLRNRPGEKFFIKTSVFRGDLETFQANGPDDARLVLNNICGDLGPYADAFEFVVEKDVDGLQVGVDAFFNGQSFLRPMAEGIERDGTVVEWVSDDGGPMARTLMDVAPILQRYGYRGALSIEGIYDGSEVHVLDFTTRFAYPLSLMYDEWLLDFAAVVADVAQGQDRRVSFMKPWMSAVVVTSFELNRWWISADRSASRFRSVFSSVTPDGLVHVAPGAPYLGAAIGGGSTMEDAEEDASEQVDATKVQFKESGLERLVEIDDDFQTYVEMVGREP